MKLGKHERVDIMPWHKGYNEEAIDLSNTVEVCHWCRQMHKYRAEPNSTSIIDRWNIGVYQLTYIPTLITHNEPREFGEAVGSVFIHMAGCFENCGVDVSEYLNYEEDVPYTSREVWRLICTHIPATTQQIYYKGKDRANRFDMGKLAVKSIKIINALVCMNNKYHDHLPFDECLMLAMAKVQEREFKTHG